MEETIGENVMPFVDVAVPMVENGRKTINQKGGGFRHAQDTGQFYCH